ncbi:uncharacterized protein BJ171DRAFT_522877 [Polychytrium aggregatum]|uniref:uncharacterized protein n=1 Tax=Polychytrium aggregatum TaxID=110093 RepID=UPI0022FDC1DF|nr:uncharacterized protein BJ171DRAFT_522877 [Polychytrium aggregatum]KAI9197149.1 hypothetical protein BJ171DRAFT_522877 [Polychytrium aggregatum]
MLISRLAEQRRSALALPQWSRPGDDSSHCPIPHTVFCHPDTKALHRDCAFPHPTRPCSGFCTSFGAKIARQRARSDRWPDCLSNGRAGQRRLGHSHPDRIENQGQSQTLLHVPGSIDSLPAMLNAGRVTWAQSRRDAREYDEKGNTKMAQRYLKQLCREQKLYQTPELNDRLYLHFKGFTKIESLEEYVGVRSLWLEGNGIGTIENLDTLTELRCLFLQQNCIEKIENVDHLSLLDTLNVSSNIIKQISGLEGLVSLKTLQIASNLLRTCEDIEGLLQCPSICILDLSQNKIDNPDVIHIFEQMPNLTVLNFMGNPAIRKIENYRRNMVGKIKGLTYLDDRPVFDKERLATEAWMVGGLEAERQERVRQQQEERDAHDRNLKALEKIQEEGRKKRIAKYGPDKEPTFSAGLTRFRDEQMEKIQTPEERAQIAAVKDPSTSTAETEGVPLLDSPVYSIGSRNTAPIRSGAHISVRGQSLGADGLADDDDVDKEGVDDEDIATQSKVSELRPDQPKTLQFPLSAKSLIEEIHECEQEQARLELELELESSGQREAPLAKSLIEEIYAEATDDTPEATVGDILEMPVKSAASATATLLETPRPVDVGEDEPTEGIQSSGMPAGVAVCSQEPVLIREVVSEPEAVGAPLPGCSDISVTLKPAETAADDAECARELMDEIDAVLCEEAAIRAEDSFADQNAPKVSAVEAVVAAHHQPSRSERFKEGPQDSAVVLDPVAVDDELKLVDEPADGMVEESLWPVDSQFESKPQPEYTYRMPKKQRSADRSLAEEFEEWIQAKPGDTDANVPLMSDMDDLEQTGYSLLVEVPETSDEEDDGESVYETADSSVVEQDADRVGDRLCVMHDPMLAEESDALLTSPEIDSFAELRRPSASGTAAGTAAGTATGTLGCANVANILADTIELIQSNVAPLTECDPILGFAVDYLAFEEMNTALPSSVMEGSFEAPLKRAWEHLSELGNSSDEESIDDNEDPFDSEAGSGSGQEDEDMESTLVVPGGRGDRDAPATRDEDDEVEIVCRALSDCEIDEAASVQPRDHLAANVWSDEYPYSESPKHHSIQ